MLACLLACVDGVLWLLVISYEEARIQFDDERSDDLTTAIKNINVVQMFIPCIFHGH